MATNGTKIMPTAAVELFSPATAPCSAGVTASEPPAATAGRISPMPSPCTVSAVIKTPALIGTSSSPTPKIFVMMPLVSSVLTDRFMRGIITSWANRVAIAMLIMPTPTIWAVCAPSSCIVSMTKNAATCITAACVSDTTTPMNKNGRIRGSEIFRRGISLWRVMGRRRSGKKSAMASAPPSANTASAKNGANK